MKSGHYMAIFVAIVVIIGAAIVFSARTIKDAPEDMTTIKAPVVQNTDNTTASKQEPIDVMKDVDMESDMEDIAADESADLSDIEALMTEESVTF